MSAGVGWPQGHWQVSRASGDVGDQQQVLGSK